MKSPNRGRKLLKWYPIGYEGWEEMCAEVGDVSFRRSGPKDDTRCSIMIGGMSGRGYHRGASINIDLYGGKEKQSNRDVCSFCNDLAEAIRRGENE